MTEIEEKERKPHSQPKQPKRSSSMIREIKGVPNIVVYKVLAGMNSGGEDGESGPTKLETYNTMVGGLAAADDLGGNDSLQLKDWRGLYTQFQREHVLGTIPYRWERGFTEATLVAVTFEQLDVVVLDDKIFHEGMTSGSHKAAVVKEHLTIPSDQALIATLGDRGYVALVRETADEWELIIPHNLLSKLHFQERAIAIFQKHPTMPVTWKWKEHNNRAATNRWLGWDDEDDDDIKCVIPDLELRWLVKGQ